MRKYLHKLYDRAEFYVSVYLANVVVSVHDHFFYTFLHI